MQKVWGLLLVPLDLLGLALVWVPYPYPSVYASRRFIFPYPSYHRTFEPTIPPICTTLLPSPTNSCSFFEGVQGSVQLIPVDQLCLAQLSSPPPPPVFASVPPRARAALSPPAPPCSDQQRQVPWGAPGNPSAYLQCPSPQSESQSGCSFGLCTELRLPPRCPPRPVGWPRPQVRVSIATLFP